MTIKIFTDPAFTRDAFPEMRVGDRRVEAHEGHVFAFTAMREVGCDTGRRRYRVACRSCRVVIHPATTGPQWQVGYHLREIRDFGEARSFPGETFTEADLETDQSAVS